MASLTQPRLSVSVDVPTAERHLLNPATIKKERDSGANIIRADGCSNGYAGTTMSQFAHPSSAAELTCNNIVAEMNQQQQQQLLPSLVNAGVFSAEQLASILAEPLFTTTSNTGHSIPLASFEGRRSEAPVITTVSSADAAGVKQGLSQDPAANNLLQAVLTHLQQQKQSEQAAALLQARTINSHLQGQSPLQQVAAAGMLQQPPPLQRSAPPPHVAAPPPSVAALQHLPLGNIPQLASLLNSQQQQQPQDILKQFALQSTRHQSPTASLAPHDLLMSLDQQLSAAAAAQFNTLATLATLKQHTNQAMSASSLGQGLQNLKADPSLQLGSESLAAQQVLPPTGGGMGVQLALQTSELAAQMPTVATPPADSLTSPTAPTTSSGTLRSGGESSPPGGSLAPQKSASSKQGKSKVRTVRKLAHTAIERRYRTSINDRIILLRDRVAAGNEKVQKSGVLQRTLHRMDELSTENSALKQDNQTLVETQERLMAHVMALHQQLSTAGLPVDEQLTEEIVSMASVPLQINYSHSQQNSPPMSPAKEAASYVCDDQLGADDVFDEASPPTLLSSITGDGDETRTLREPMSSGEQNESIGSHSHLPSSPVIDRKRLGCIAFIIALPVMHMAGISLGGGLHRGGADMRTTGDYARLHSGGRVLASTAVHKADFWTVWWPMIYFIGQFLCVVAGLAWLLFRRHPDQKQAERARQINRLCQQADLNNAQGRQDKAHEQLQQSLHLIGCYLPRNYFSLWASLFWQILYSCLLAMYVPQLLAHCSHWLQWHGKEVFNLSQRKWCASFAAGIYCRLANIMCADKPCSHVWRCYFALCAFNAARVASNSMPACQTADIRHKALSHVQRSLPSSRFAYVLLVLLGGRKGTFSKSSSGIHRQALGDTALRVS